MPARARLAAIVASLLLAGVEAAAAQQDFAFGLFGDLAYTAADEPLLENVLADLNRTPLAFVVHVGDLGHPRTGSCTDALRARRLAQFRGSANALIYTPGDNDWTDCHDQQGVPGGDPLERLAKLRTIFFADELSLGQRSIPLTRQSAGTDPSFAKYRENARWELGGVTFLTLHVVGSNNGRGRTTEGDAEFAERNEANLAWLRAGFEHAKAAGSRAVMIMQQANIFPDLPPVPSDAKQQPSGFTELRAALAKEAQAFGRTVVLVHGDSHYFRIDKPLMRLRKPNEPAIENFTRVETFGSPHHHWVHVTVDPDDPNVFTFRQRIVPANLLKGR
jgi:hypothetical protein